ncbi:MAG: DUF4476 domain-containing protein [Chitinophagaceae bacterium]
MKTVFILIASFFILANPGISQVTVAGAQVVSATSTVTINVTGTRYKQIIVDNQPYTIDNSSTTEEKAIVVSNLENGQHTLDLVRRSQYNSTSRSTFTLRNGYDMTIDISSTGAVTLSEQRRQRDGGYGDNEQNAISTNAFNKLYKQVKNKSSSTSKASFLENEFTNTNKRFTARQASQLIQLVNSESLRFKLAKESYSVIVDKENFTQVSNLLNSTSNRSALDQYIASLPEDDDTDDGNASTPMSNQKFQVIYNEVLAEQGTTDKNYYLSNFFTKDFNYYTSAQARQLIQLIPTEAERFYLAKVAYRGITDRENYGQVSNLLSSSYNRSELAVYIRTYDNNNTTTRPAMTTADFDRLYQTVYYQSSASARYTSINNAFATSGYYFTVAQAKKMILLVNDENTRLILSKASYKSLVDRSNYTQFYELLNSTSSRNDLNAYVINYDRSNGTGMGGVAMTDVDFNRLYNSVNSAWNTSTRINLVGDAFRSTTNYFNVYQVRQLLLLITSEADRLTLAKSSYDNIVDPSNYTQLYDLFNTTAYKNELARYYAEVQNGGSGTIVKTPMTQSEFNTLVREVEFTFGLGAKMTKLSQIFNTETYYFTVAQARQLIQMVSLETNRVELAKSAYNNLSDPTNFRLMYDIFSSQSSKDELDAYVGSNAYLNN